MRIKAIQELRKGDRIATSEEEVDARVYIVKEAGLGIVRKPFRGGEPVPAWLVGWTWCGGAKAGQNDFDFFAPDDKVRMR